MCSQPWIEPVEAEYAGVVQAIDEGKGLERVCDDRQPVDRRENVGCGEGRPLVAIDKRMVLRKTFLKSRCFSDQIVVVAGLRPEQRRLQRTQVADALAAAKAFDEIFVDGENIGGSQVIRQRARRS